MPSDKMNFRENDKMISVHFDSLLDCMDHEVDSTSPTGVVNSRGFKDCFTRTEYGSAWFGAGCRQSQEVLNYALLGNNPLMKILPAMIQRLNERVGTINGQEKMQTVETSKRKRVRGRFGDEIDIHKVYSGQLDKAWQSMKRETSSVQQKLICLVIDIGASGGEDVKDTLWQAAVAMKLHDDLIRAGKSVKIIVGGSVSERPFNEMKRKGFTGSITVKNYNEKISIERLCGMVHAGFYRACIFSTYYAQSKYTPTSSLGRCTALNENYAPLNIQEEMEKGITVPIFVKKSRDLNSAASSLEDAKRRMNTENSI